MDTNERLFIGVFPCAISYCDKSQEVDHDYKKVASLPYDTLKLKFFDCPEELKAIIEKDAARYKKGQLFKTATHGGQITLGNKI